jgi:hypothetical protein
MYDSGRDNNRVSQSGGEQREKPGSGNEPGPKWQSTVFRDESPYQRGRRNRDGARRRGYGTNVHDLEAVLKLIRADDDFINEDAGYTGIEERAKIKNDGRLSKIGCRINRWRGGG